MRVLLLLLAASVAAYVRIPGHAVRLPIDLKIGRAFTLDETRIVAEAADSWNEALDTTAIRVWGSAATGGWQSHLLRYDGPSGNTVMEAVYTRPRSWIVLRVNISLGRQLWGNSLYNTALHEVGHALGLEHSPESELMGGVLVLDQSGLPLPIERTAISADDVAGVLAGQREGAGEARQRRRAQKTVGG